MFEDRDFASIMIDLDSNKETAKNYINTHDFHWTEWGWDPTSPTYHPIFNMYNDYNGGSNGIPQTVVIDADANVRYAKLGMISDNSILITVINQLI
jgi:hypothetical protein